MIAFSKPNGSAKADSSFEADPIVVKQFEKIKVANPMTVTMNVNEYEL